MRVLFLAMPPRSHLFPMVPLAWALRAAGHEVLVATAEDCLVATAAGLPVADVAPGLDIIEVYRPVIQRHPEIIQPGHPAARDLRNVALIFGAMNAALAPGIAQCARRWRPDLVVHETFAAAGGLVAAMLGVPSVQLDFMLADMTGIPEAVVAGMGASAELHFGVDRAAPPAAVLDVAPPSMMPPRTESWAMRYVPYGGGMTIPRWLMDEPDRSRIVVTAGTTQRGPGALPRILEILADLDAEVLVAGPPATTEGLGRLPRNVRAAEWLPLPELLPSCAAIIHHGGAGTLFAALLSGTPQLLLPEVVDRFINAEAVCARGVGLATTIDRLDAGMVDRLLHDRAIGTATAEVQAEIEARPAPVQLVNRLKAIA